MNQKVTVIVKVIEARDISPVENKGELLDAFAQVRLGENEFKTAVCRRSTSPVWREEVFRIEIDEKTLYDEPLQIRVLDHEAYTANDTIGGVLFNLVNLLNVGYPYRMDGWLPLLDPVHGIRGEIHLIVKIELLSHISRPHSLCVLNTSIPPMSPKILQLFGVIDDTLVESDPETEWRDKLRSARASDDVRQLIIARLAIELQQRVASRAADVGGNAVIGYRQIVEADGVGGLIARAIGTAVWLDQGVVPVPPGVIPASSSRSHISMTPDCPFFTLTSYPPGVIVHIGGIITARAVRIASDNRTAEMYRRWFGELKQELKLQLDSSGYDAAIGYREQIAIFRELIVVSACATAGSLGRSPGGGSFHRNRSSALSKSLDRQSVEREKFMLFDGQNDGKISPDGSGITSCSLFHIPHETGIPGLSRCQRAECANGWVPQVLLCSIDPPSDVNISLCTGLLRTCVTRQRRRDISTEFSAKEVSDALPYLEHELYRDMLAKMRTGGWNAVFNLDIQLTVSEELIILTGTGTGVFLKTLPVITGVAPPSPDSPTQVNPLSSTPSPTSAFATTSPLALAPSHLSSFALIYRIPSNQLPVTWPERVLQLTRYRCRKSRVTALSAIKLRLIISGDQAHWMLIGAALGSLPPPTINPPSLHHHSSSSSLSSSSMVTTPVTPVPTTPSSSARVISTVLPSLLPSYTTKRHLFRVCVTVVRECDDLDVVVAESLELLRAFAALFGATAVLSVHIDLCQAAERQSIVVVSGDAAIINTTLQSQMSTPLVE